MRSSRAPTFNSNLLTKTNPLAPAGAQTNGAAAQAQQSIEDDPEEGHSNDDDSMEEDDTEGGSTDNESMEGSDAEEGSTDVPMSDTGAVGGSDGEELDVDYMTLTELAANYPSLVLKQDWAPESRTVNPVTHMVDILVHSLDPRGVTDQRTLLRTCRLLQLGGLPLVDETPLTKKNTTSYIPKKLADFVKQCSNLQGPPFSFGEAAKDWKDACNDIKEGGGWEPLADALFDDVFKRLCSYEAVKEWFQRRNFRVNAWTSGFGHIDAKGDVYMRSDTQLKTNFHNKYYWKIVEIPETPKAEGRVEIQNARFIGQWLADDQEKKFESVDCAPPGCEVEPDVFNTWPGFRAEKLPAIPDDQVDTLIKLLLEHIQEVICSTPEQAQYFLAWLAQQVQDPAHKSGVGIILYGEQGAGKDIIITWYIEYLLGVRVGVQTASVSHILGKHATSLQNKVLCVLDEADYDQLKPHLNVIKSLMTDENLNLNPKNKDLCTTRSLIRIMLTTNVPKPIHLEAGDRRWVVLEVNDSKKGDTAYFQKLGKSLDDKAARAFYQFLMKFDLSGYTSFEARRPDTQICREMKEGNLSAFHTFLSHECMRHAGETPLFLPVEKEAGGSTETPEKIPEKTESCLSGSMFDKFKEWAAGANFSVGGYTKTHLGQDFTKIINKNDAGVERKRSGPTNVYIIEWSKLEKCLKRCGLFNNNI
jgi:hypothetical protein